MAINPEDTELDESGEPVIPFDEEINAFVVFFTIIETFLLAISLGLGIEKIQHSPAIFVLGAITGFLVILASWLCGFVTIGLFGGKFSWVNALFTLLEDEGFRASIILLCGMFFIARVLAGIFEKLSYEKKKKICKILLFLIAVNVVWLCKLLKYDTWKYIFIYALTFIPYVIVAFPRDR